MGNVYDQFDAPAPAAPAANAPAANAAPPPRNIYDQFDAPAAAPRQPQGLPALAHQPVQQGEHPFMTSLRNLPETQLRSIELWQQRDPEAARTALTQAAQSGDIRSAATEAMRHDPRGFWEKLGTPYGTPEQRQRALSTLGTELRLTARGVPLAGGLVPQTQEMTDYEQSHPGRAGMTQVLGSMVGMAPAMAAAPVAFGLKGSQALANAPRIAQWGSRVGLGTATNAGVSAADQATREALAPTTGTQPGDPTALLRGLGLPSTGSPTGDAALTAGLANLTGEGIGAAVGKGIYPGARTAAEYLYRRGVRMTGGQAAGTGYEAVERLGQVVPFSGVTSQREATMASYNRGAENEVLRILHGEGAWNGTDVPRELPSNVHPGNDGRQAIREVFQGSRDANGNATPGVYDRAYQGTSLALTPRLYHQITDTLQTVAGSGVLSEPATQRLAGLIDGQVTSRFEAVMGQGRHVPPILDSAAYSTMDTNLREIMEAYRQGGGDDRMMSGALGHIRQAIQDEFAAQNPRAAARVASADRAWAAYVRLRTAGARTSVQGVEGLITPEGLDQAALHEDKSYAGTRYSEGDALMQPYARAGKEILRGEPGQTQRWGERMAGVMALAEGVRNPKALALLTALAGGSQLAYSSPVQNIVTAALMGGQAWRQPLRQAIAPAAGQAAQQRAKVQAMQMALAQAYAQRGQRGQQPGVPQP